MEKAVVHVALAGLLLTFTSTLPNKDDWNIYTFHINSTVSGRYATTVITSRVANRMDESKEIEFHVRIPKNAFITKFRMFMDGEVYDGVVKAKEQAQQQYTDAVSRGQSAGIVSSVGRTLEEFKTSVNVAAHKKVTFELTYEELLRRQLGKYELQIHAQPMQPVKDFKIDVHIHEKAGISFLEVKGGLSTKALANAITKTLTDKEAWVYFYPTEDQQKNCDSCGEQGMNGDLVIVYDVNRDNLLGDIKKSDGYFVHHFAPVSLPGIPKNVVFVIDRSGSMAGKKIEQTRTALIHILGELAEEDFFGLITFDGNIAHWKQELVQATKENVDSAKSFAKKITDRGATDINAAVLEGTHMLNAHEREGSASLLILLTDGDPTVGETNPEKIRSNVRKAIGKKFPLYCLGFGFDVSFEFLEKMALENSGMARRIYEDSDADLQLKGFYEEVATPLLIDVTMTYAGGTNLTQTTFSQYYNGSEIVVAGQITNNNIEEFTPLVVAISKSKKLTFVDNNATVESTGTTADKRVQRIWAYLTVKQLLDKELQLSGHEKEKVKKEALDLSLKYSFVTPLTSMVVTKPPGENIEVLHKPKEGQPPEEIEMHSAHGQPFFAQRAPLRPGGKRFGLKKQSVSSRTIGGGAGLGGGAWSDVFMRPPVVPNFLMIIDVIPTAPDVVPTVVPTVEHTFLLKAENQSHPICFDIIGRTKLKLLQDPSSKLSVNGELDSAPGFKKIVIHYKPDSHVQIDASEISIHDEQNVTFYSWSENTITAGSVTLICRDKEIDISGSNFRMVIFLHQKQMMKFLWLVLRQATFSNAEGLLAVKTPDFKVLLKAHSPTIKIQTEETDVKRAIAVDYSIPSAPAMECWHSPAEVALQRPLDVFIVHQL
ncbi:inter-alpha-trypsin inhibitor heavy chain H3b [Thalassophryne amazonica]|uniref:inter-alpha-trypsin inhibitor heavy chain H3b n=1 Tax=Thalassophryne amazonica TaxID=390379 RepID=UPI00147109CF|nr:inter-alpha-trypsin inhibitor heavy chain H3b [Thalassophryne amazonica]